MIYTVYIIIYIYIHITIVEQGDMMFFMFVFFLPIIKAPSTENIEIGRAFSDGRLSLRWPIYGPRIEAPALSIDEMGHGK
jgi:hypothetical protein